MIRHATHRLFGFGNAEASKLTMGINRITGAINLSDAAILKGNENDSKSVYFFIDFQQYRADNPIVKTFTA